MIDRFGDLPSHPLLVHLPVVLVPLALLGWIVLAVRPRWQRALGPVVAVIAGLGFAGAILAGQSGEDLQDEFRDSGMTIGASISDHAELGERVPLVAGAFFLLVLAWVLTAAWRRQAGEERAAVVLRSPRAVLAGLMVLSLLAGTVATVSVIRAGHSGAESVWDGGADGAAP